MSGYGSPTPIKMEAAARHRAKPSFSFDRILGDPFALATCSIAIMAWLLTFVSAIISSINQYPPHHFPNFAWWGVAFYLLCIVGVILVIALDAIDTYHVAVVAFLSYALFLSTSATDNTVYDSNGPHQAAAAGFILLSALSVVWIFYFGTQTSSRRRGVIDSYALHGSNGQGPPSGGSRHLSSGMNNQYNQSFTNAQPPATGRLHGLETSSPEIRYPEPPSSNPRASPGPPQPRGFGNSPGSPSNNPYRNSTANTNPASTAADESVSAPTEYPYRARAIYSYEANPDDANEISFTKHEILEVSDVSGRWWQARKATGETGIAPSNYLILL